MKKSAAAVALAATAALGACGHGSASTGMAHRPLPRASVSALASVPGADARQVLIRAGVPVHGTSAQQLAFGKAMLSKGNRKALAQKLAIPPARRPAFEAAVLDAAKGDHVLKPGNKAGRVKFFDRDLPGLLARFA